MRLIRYFLLPLCQLFLLPVSGLYALLMRLVLPVDDRPLSGTVKWTAPQNKAMSVSIIILNFNGKRLLRNCLNSVLAAVLDAGYPYEIILVDNGSDDGSIDFVRENYGEKVRIIPLAKNYGFSEGNNKGAEAARYDYLLFLNNDMIVDPQFMHALTRRFTDPGVFAVTSHIRPASEDGEWVETGRTQAWQYRGELQFLHAPVYPDYEWPAEVPVLWAGGGSSLYDRGKFLALGGFAGIYGPAYFEDTDLSFRAWKRGWRSLWSADSLAYHERRATTKKVFTQKQLDYIELRNKWLFHFSNLTDRCVFDRTLRGFVLNFVSDMRKAGIRIWIRVLGDLIKSVNAFRTARRFTIESAQFHDEDILSLNRCRLIPPERRGMSLNILIVSAYMPRADRSAGGGRVVKLGRELSKRHHADLLTYYDGEHEKDCLPQLGKIFGRIETIDRTLQRKGRHFHEHIPGEIRNNFWSEAMRFAVWQACHSGLYDLIQIEWIQMSQFVPAHVRCAKFLTHHDAQSLAMKIAGAGEKNPYRAVLGRLRRHRMLCYEIGELRRYDRAVFLSVDDAVHFLEYDPDLPAVVNSMGVDLDEFGVKRTAAGNKAVLFVGNFSHYPNVDAVQFLTGEIWPKVRKQEPDAELWIVGNAPPANIFEKSGKDGISITGWVPDLKPYLEAAQVFAAPLRLGTGQRNKLIEAMAAHLPVVTTDIGCAGLLGKGKNIVCIGNTAVELANGIVRLLRESRLRKDFAGRAYLHAAIYFDNQKNVRALEAIYKKTCGLKEDNLKYTDKAEGLNEKTEEYIMRGVGV